LQRAVDHLRGRLYHHAAAGHLTLQEVQEWRLGGSCDEIGSVG
jgi:hypothetical protein